MTSQTVERKLRQAAGKSLDGGLLISAANEIKDLKDELEQVRANLARANQIIARLNAERPMREGSRAS